MAKRPRSVTSTLSTSWEYPIYDASLLQIWWFRRKSVTSYRADNTNFLKLLVKITLKGKVNEFHRGELSCGQGEVYGRVDRRMTDAGNDNTPSAWKARG